MALATVHSLATWLSRSRRHESLLGTAVPGAYRHLFDPAGVASRPPTVRRGVTTLHASPYDAPTADDALRVSQLASAAVDRLLAGQGDVRSGVRAVFNTQCTLDQQILGSTCLRVCHEHVPQARLARSFGQLGTAGVPTVLRLAAMQVAADKGEGRVCVTACDKWIAPFFRHVPRLVVHGDAAAACLIGPPDGDGIALVEDIATLLRPFEGDLWTAPAEVLREHLIGHATAVVDAVRGDGAPPWVAGDRYLDGMGEAVAARAGLAALHLPLDASEDAPHIHLSSASPLFELSRAMEACVARREPLRVIVWTASISGFAGAMRLVCHPGAQRRGGSWHPATAAQPRIHEPSHPD